MVLRRLVPVALASVESRRRVWQVNFQWSVTNGIDVDKIAAGLPAHLQLEMKVQLNKRLVEQVLHVTSLHCPAQHLT